MKEEEEVFTIIDDETMSLDGYFTLSTDDAGVYVAVYPPQGTGEKVKLPQVLNGLEEYGVDKFDNALLVQVVKESLGMPVKVAEKPVEVEPEIQVLVARDRMEATVQAIMPRGCRPVTVDEIMNKIARAGIVYGVDHKAIEAALARPGSTVVCAVGLRPVDGSAARIAFHVDLENKGRPAEMEDGRVDFKNLNLYTTVHKDELLAEKIPATQGTPGLDILGNEVAAKPGKDIMLPIGKNVYAVDALKIHASQAGRLVVINGKVNIVPVIEIKGDVDLSTGNIEFVGSVVVQGSVQNGFTVKAEGNVEIAGNVSGGTVEGQNVIVRMGIQGMNRGYIKASENVIARYSENATIQAGKDVIISDVILHSKVSAGQRVIVEERRGLIVGGRTAAGEEIRAKILGAASATNTDVEVGVNPELRDEYQDLRKQVRKLETSREQAQKAIALLKAAADQGSLAADKRDVLLRLTKTQFHLGGQIETMNKRTVEIEKSLEEMRFGKIKVADAVYPGVKLIIGTLVKPIRDIIRFSSFYAENGEIKTGSFL